jgi:uncharacterized membrane protein
MVLKFLLGMPPLLYAIIISMLPFFELRGGIPFAVAAGTDVWQAFVFCTIANIAVIPLIYLFLDTLHGVLMKISLYKRIFTKVVHKTRKKVEKYVQKYGYFGLLIFVSIPIPGSGAWAGVLGAWLLGMEKIRAMKYIAAGVAVAGIILALGMRGILFGLNGA